MAWSLNQVSRYVFELVCHQIPECSFLKYEKKKEKLGLKINYFLVDKCDLDMHYFPIITVLINRSLHVA